MFLFFAQKAQIGSEIVGYFSKTKKIFKAAKEYSFLL